MFYVPPSLLGRRQVEQYVLRWNLRKKFPLKVKEPLLQCVLVFFFRFLIWKKFRMNLICITSSKSILLLCRLALWCRGISLEETHSPFIYVKTWPHHGGVRKTYKILFFVTQVFLCHRYIGSFFILISTSKSWSAMVRPYWWGLYLCRWTWRNWAGVQLDIPSLLTSKRFIITE